MELIRALHLDQGSAPRVAFVGAGGKTTAMFQSARGFSSTVLVTVTTHLAVDQLALADHHIFEDQISNLEIHMPPGVSLITGSEDGNTGRTLGVSLLNLEYLLTLAEKQNIPLLIEADGSRQHPCKAPASHEPPIPDFVDTVIVVAGLSGLGQPLTNEYVHRPEVFASLSGIELNAPITPAALTQVLMHPTGGLKNIPAGARRLVMLNQADTPALQARAAGMATDLLSVYDAVIISSLQPSNSDSQSQIHAVHEKNAAVILAAGESRRFGSPKQLLDWHGQPLIWHVARRAIQAGLSPVIVVCGAQMEPIRKVLCDLPVTLIHNLDWQLGQGTSVRAGVGAVPAQNGCILFLLADQPQIPVTLLRALVAEHAQTLHPIIAPMIDGQRANPVLFDQVTFSDLLSLSGEMGGRKLFSKYPIHWLPWHDPAPLLDVDTPADYQRLLELES
jgi:molybdenum cofactor cytidylyltransferase